jgi:hypothetical protein
MGGTNFKFILVLTLPVYSLPRNQVVLGPYMMYILDRDVTDERSFVRRVVPTVGYNHVN